MENTKTIYTKNDILRLRDKWGTILTYCIVDAWRPELKDFTVIETNTLKEINDFIKNQ